MIVVMYKRGLTMDLIVEARGFIFVSFFLPWYVFTIFP